MNIWVYTTGGFIIGVVSEDESVVQRLADREQNSIYFYASLVPSDDLEMVQNA